MVRLLTRQNMAATSPVSVVVPLYNKGNCVGRAIRSILSQTVPCSEIIVVDDGSTDDGYRVVEGIEDSRIKLFRQTNQGPSPARNKGIAEAHGDLVAFLDADDEWRPSFLATILSLWAKYPEAGAYATAYEIVEPWGDAWVPKFREIPPPPWEGIVPSFFRSAIGICPVWTSAIVIRKEVFGTVGHFVQRSGVGEDADLWARIALRYPIAFSWQVGAVYHREAENRYCENVFTHVFTSGHFEHSLQEQAVPSHMRSDVEAFLAHEKLTAASRHVLGGQPAIARDILRNCNTHRFLRQRLWWWFWSLLPRRAVGLAWRSKRWFFRSIRSWKPRPDHCQ
jgi:glycosyltransferase involved in cell wall biosynthesis